MPISDHWAMPWVLDAVRRSNSQSILDFGMGMGAYGFQIRQAFDIGVGLLTPEEWHLRIDGLEMFHSYRNPVWDYYYNKVIVEDGRTWLQGVPSASYDLILFCDVIEHFDKEEALRLLEKMRSVARWVIVTTPCDFFPQGASFGNEAERHRSVWNPREFTRLGAYCLPINLTFMAVFGPDPATIKAMDLGGLPLLFTNTATTLCRGFCRWLPRMLKSRLMWNHAANSASEGQYRQGHVARVSKSKHSDNDTRREAEMDT